MAQRSSVLSSHRYLREGFQQIPELNAAKTGNPNDATIDIPLTTVTGKPAAWRADAVRSPTSSNEKSGLFHSQAGGRRRRVKGNHRGNQAVDGSEGTITRMGEVYKKIRDFSVITRYWLYILPVALAIAVPIVVGATAKQNASMGDVRIVWIFTWVEIVWLSLWISKLAAKAAPYIFQFLCGIVSPGTRKYVLILEALEIPMSFAGWALASLATFRPLMTQNPDQRRLNQEPNHAGTPNWVDVVGHVLAALMVAALIFLLEKVLVQLISIGYHRKQFDLKIHESKHNIYLLSLLYDASRTLFPAFCNEFAEEDYLIDASIAINLPLSRRDSGGARPSSAAPIRLIQDVGRMGDKITAAFGKVAQEVTGKQVFNPTSAHSVVVEALEKKKSSEALAKRLWVSFVVEGNDALYREDVVEVLGSERQVEAEECFNVLDRDGNGDVSLDEMIMTVCEFGRERKSIAGSLYDVGQAINVLDNLLCTIVFVVIIFVFVAFLNASFTTTLATAGTVLLSLSFVFATTAQEVLGSCIFLFVKHPFDVGDRIDIGEEQLLVEHISLLFTVFKKVKTHKTTQVPNIVLNGLWIENVSRSKAMREQLLVYISFDTSLEDIQLLKGEIQNFVLGKENSRDFQPDVEVEVTGLAEMNKMELKVEIKHKSNWSNEALRTARRSKFMCALVLALRKVPINAPGGGNATLGSADQPTYLVSVSDAEAAAARDAFKKTKEANRLVTSLQSNDKQPPTVDLTMSPTDHSAPPTVISSPHDRNSATAFSSAIAFENAALTALNARHPAIDPAHDWEREDVATATPYRIGFPPSWPGGDSHDISGVLRRQSTRGKRHVASTTSMTSGRPPTLGILVVGAESVVGSTTRRSPTSPASALIHPALRQDHASLDLSLSIPEGREVESAGGGGQVGGLGYSPLPRPAPQLPLLPGLVVDRSVQRRSAAAGGGDAVDREIMGEGDGDGDRDGGESPVQSHSFVHDRRNGLYF